MKLHLAELSRRGVFKTLVAYAIASWVLIEVSDVIGGAFLLPEWFVAAMTTLLVLGAFPVVLLSWRYDITWEGIKRDTSRVDDEVERSARRISAFLVLFLLTVTTALWVNYFLSHSENELENLVQSQLGAPEIGEDGRIVSMAVLPFDDFSPEGGKQWVADSIADAILHQLSQNRDLIVTAKTSSFGFRDSGRTAAEIGKALGVQALLEGSVQVIGDRIRVTSQFVRTSDQAHIWSDVHEATIEDWFDIQDAIATKVTELILPHSRPEDQRGSQTRPPSLEAYRLLMVGRDLVGLSDTNDEAVKLIGVVVEIWPEYADAWAWLAEARTKQMRLLYESDTASHVQVRKATENRNEALETALRLDPDNPVALIRKGYAESGGHAGTVHEALERVLELAPNDAEVLARLAGLALYTADFPLAESLTGRARIVDPADYEIFESSLWPACGRDSLAPRVEKQLADYPTTPVNTLRMRQWAAACDGEYADWAQLAIEQARIDRDPGSALRALLVLASMDFPEALNRVGAAQRILAGQFSTDPVVPPAYFTSILPERLETWRRYLGAGFEGGDGYGVALLLAGEYGQVEKLVDDGIRLWERWYQGIDWIWHTETLETFAWKAWLLTERGERDQAAELAGEMMQALRDKELTEWSGSHKLLYDLPLMILLLNGEERQALDWLADAEQARWLHFQPLLTSPVYAEFRELPEAAATLERMTAWRARVLDEVLAMGLPEVENPDLLLDYMAALARPSHHERARIALHFDDDPAGALGHYANALREDPDNARIIQQAADLALEFGLVDEAVRLLEHAAAVAPDDADTHSSLSLAYGHAKRWPEAVASARRAVELQPDAGFFQRWLGQMLLMNGEAHEAEDVFSQIRNEGQRNMGLIMAYHALGRIDESDALLSEWLESAWGPSFFVAYVLAFRGDKDPAFEWLEKAAATERIVNTAATFPMLLNLHDDPRWLPFLERIGKSPEQLAGIELKLSLPPPATSQRVSQAGE